MKRTFLPAVLSAVILLSCSDTKKQEQQEKQIYSELMYTHDELMEYEGVIMENKETLDSLAKAKPALTDSAAILNKALTVAEDAMGDWMHQFEPDYSTKSHDEAMKYLTAQKQQINRVDSLTRSAARASGKFISNHK